MGRKLYKNNNTVRDIFNRVDDLLRYKLTKIMFKGPEDELRQTKNSQIAIFILSYCLYQLLNIQPDMAAGHSLGEFTALVSAEALTFDDALQLVKVRAEAMQSAATLSKGTMAAILGFDEGLVEDICSKVRASIGIIQIANFNCPGQVVISGSPEAVDEVIKQTKERGALFVKKLNVSGAFHSPLMGIAQPKLAEALKETPIQSPKFPVYANVTGRPFTDADNIRLSLPKQLISPVQWQKTVQQMISDGADEIIEVGPGDVLQGLCRRISKGINIRGVCDLASIEAFCER